MRASTVLRPRHKSPRSAKWPTGLTLSRRHRLAIYVTFGALYMSGVAWLVLRQWFAHPDDLGGVHPMQPLCMSVHGAVVLAYLVVLGTLLPTHVERWWTAGMGRIGGAWLVGVNLALIASGYALYYGSAERLRALSSACHIWIGALSPALVILHVRSGRKQVRGRWRAASSA